MKAIVKYKVNIITEEIDLEDYGHDEDVRFEDLTEDEQNHITDSLIIQNYIQAYVETIDK